MFDAYALLQAQEQLKISDEQYSRFLAAVQGAAGHPAPDAAAAYARARGLRRLLIDGADRRGADQGSAQALQDIDSRGQAEARKAYEAIDQVLDLRQQAQFRVFEEQMERRKIELVTRARQANRANRQQRQGDRVP